MTVTSGAGETLFFGRSVELADLDKRFEDARLVTIVGPGGIGKTRVALEWSRRWNERGHASFVCRLSDARSEADVVGSLSAALGEPVTATSVEDAIEELGEALSDPGEALLIFDNAEAVTKELAVACEHCLMVAPELLILVTSRERLGHRDESTIELGPLEMQDAVELFSARASEHGSEWDQEGRSAVERIVAHLDGYPLAVEMAAARSNVLAPSKIEELIVNDLGRLGSRVDQDRGDIWSVMEWSWTHLDAAARRALACCSVFRGSFSLDSFGAVFDQPLRDCETQLNRLRERALLLREDDGRYHLYECLRQFGAAQLDSMVAQEEGGPTWKRPHAEHFVALAARSEGDPWLELIPNLRTAQRRFLHEDPRLCAQAGLALLRLTLFTGPGSLWLATRELTEEAAQKLGDPVLLTELAIAGATPQWRTNYDQLRVELEQAVGRAQHLRRDDLHSDAVRSLAAVEYQAGFVGRTLEHLRTSLKIAKAMADPYREARAIGGIGIVLRYLGESSEARDALQHAIALDDGIAAAIAYQELGGLERDDGELELAAQHYSKAVERFEQHGAASRMVLLEASLGDLALKRGDFDKAQKHFEDVIVASRAQGLAEVRARATLRLAIACFAKGQRVAALAHLDDAASLWARSAPAFEWLALAYRGAIGASIDLAEGERLIEEAEDRFGIRERDDNIDATRSLRGFLDLARAKQAEAEGDTQGRREHLDKAKARLAEPLRSYEGHRAKWLLQQELRRINTAVGVDDDAASGPQVSVEETGAWFQIDQHDVVHLARRKAMRRIVAGLARAHSERPDRGLTGAELLELGWPQEHVDPDAGSKRVRVALTTLRKLGLRDVLHRDASGYRLAGRVRLIHER